MLTTDFLDFIVSPGENKLLEIRLIDTVGRAKSYFFSSTGEALRFLTSQNLNEINVYYGVLPRKERGGSKESVVDYANTIWVDVDVLEEEECKVLSSEEIKTKCLAVYEEVKAKFEEKGISPAIAVYTGHGVQIIFKLTKEVSKEEIEELNSILIELLKDFGADRNVKDCARVLRLPGFLNWKDPEKPLKAEVIEFNPDVRVEPDKILDLKPAITSSGKFSAKTWKRLHPSRKEELVKTFSEFYRPGHRQNIVFHLSGYLAKSGIHPLDTAEILHRLLLGSGNDEPKARFEALAWSYGRISTTEEVVSSIHEFAKLYGILREDIERWVNSASKGEPEKLRGSYNQLREEIREVLKQSGKPEDEASTVAVEVVSKLEEIVGEPVEKGVLGVPIKINKVRNYRISYVNNPEKGIARVKYPLNGWDVLEFDYISSFYIDSVEVLYDPSTGERKYSITVYYPGKRELRHFPPLTLDELVELLKAQEGVRKSQSIRDAVSSLIDAFEAKGRAEVKATALTTGFVEVNGKLHFFNYEKAPVKLPEPSKERLREALELLNELAEKYHYADGFIAGIFFGLIQPLGFVKKQNHARNLILLLWGEPKTGKSTIGDIVIAMWGAPRTKPFYVSGDSIKSEARLGEYLNDTTLPIVVNEVRSSINLPHVSDMLKNSRSELVARNRIEKGIHRTFYARASVMMTTNYLPLITDPGLVESLAIFQFTAKQKPSKEERDEFAKWFGEIKDKLAYIGAYLKKIYIENWDILKPHILKEDFIDPGRRILKFLYVEAGLEPPEWINKELTPSEVEEEIDELDLILGTLRYDLLEACRRVGLNVLAEELATWWDRIIQLDKIGALPEYLQLSKDQNKVYINPAIVEAVRRKTNYEIAGGLKNIAEKYGFKYGITPDRKKKAIIISLADFSRMLGDDEAEDSSSEADNTEEIEEYVIDMTRSKSDLEEVFLK